MSLPVRWPAPAKINLFLHVVGRRADGYHLLQTAFQFLDLCDEIEITVDDTGTVRRTGGNEGVPEAEDLAVRAARALLARTASRGGAALRLHKRIPLGGGLGGGSSDAATVLLALNRLWGLGLGEAALAELAVELGADVPVFVFGRAAWAEGVGERLEAIDPPQPWYLVVHPGCGVATGRVFSDPQLTRDTPLIRIRDFLAGRAGNDCEAVVRRLYPEVGRALDWLTGFAPARLTGTGACVFSAFSSREAAAAAARRLPPEWAGYVVRGLNRSPLRELLAEG